MRLIVLTLLLAVALVSALPAARRASAAAAPHGPSFVVAQGQTLQSVPSNDDSRVGVQVGVLCAAVVVVVGVGMCAYFVRRALGLSGPPPQDAGGHH